MTEPGDTAARQSNYDWLRDQIADLLTYARQTGCGCEACVQLRTLWTHLQLDEAVRDQAGQVPRPLTVCISCWQAPELEAVRTGRAGLAAVVTPGHCTVCGMPTI